MAKGEHLHNIRSLSFEGDNYKLIIPESEMDKLILVLYSHAIEEKINVDLIKNDRSK